MSKYTNGNEYVLLNNEDYKGFYNIGPDGKLYTGKNYIFGISQLLKLKNKFVNSDIDKEDINEIVKKYIQLNPPYIENGYINVNYKKPVLTEKDYEENNKTINRYFCQNSNNVYGKIYEIDENQFNKLKTIKYWKIKKIEWRVTGSDIYSFNEAQVKKIKKIFPAISSILNNYNELTILKKDDIKKS